MYNELFGKEDYEITLDEFKAEMNKALQSLVGRNVQEVGISQLVSEATEDLMVGCFECDGTLFYEYCPELDYDDMVQFGRAFVTYKSDARYRCGEGYVIESIRFEYTHPHLAEIAEHVCDISQVLTYDTAKARRDECNARISELNEELIKLKAFVNSYTEIMKVEKYF